MLLSVAAWAANPVAITNASFEQPPIETDGATGPAPTGWSAFNGADIGTLNPAEGDFTGEAPDGQNVATVYGADGSDEGLSQVLAATFIGQASYSLTVEVGNPATIGGFPGYRVQLLANGTVLAEDNNSLTVPPGTFVTSLVTYSYQEAHAPLVGQPLEIRLLSKGLFDESEVDFDHVRLAVTLTQPFADAGGPYIVSPSRSLSLNGSGSLPSGAGTITTYEWDLNDDGVFGDVTGPMPSAISFQDLQDVWDMDFGPNPVHLRVTDSADETATASTTVYLVLAVPTAGFDFLVDAAEAEDEDEYWNDLVEENPTGLGLRVDKSAGNEVTRQAVTGSNTFLTHAFQFPGGKVNNVGGALLVNSNTTTTRSFANIGWNTQPVTIEMWIKPANLTPTPANGQILFEDGGGTGMGLFLSNNQIQFRKVGGSGLVSYNLSVDSLGLLEAPATAEFIQVVGTYNATGGAMQLFINGALAGSGTASGGGSWTGGDAAAFGTRGGSNTGGIGGGQSNTESFQGQIALIRAYRNRILTANEVLDNYRSIAPDATPPAIAALSPANGAGNIYPGIGTLNLTLDEDVTLTGGGVVTLKNLTAATEQVFSLPHPAVTLDGRKLVIGLAANLAFSSQFAVRISNDAVRDMAGNLFAGIANDTTWTFTTAAQNLNPPVITVKSPVHEAVQVGIGTIIVATFDQTLLLGSGDIVIKDLVDDSTTLTVPVADAAQVSLADNVLTINPTGLLAGNRSYAVRIPSTALRNFSDVDFGGITSDTEWTFTTSLLSSHLSILDLTANGNINPATNEPWKHADRFRLVFISSEEIDPKVATPFGDWNSIETWNAIAQDFAAKGTDHDLSGVAWKVIGSTLAVNARDNTATNPLVNGSGHPIMLIDGKTIVAGDFNELWGPAGHQIRNVINLTENKGQHINDAPAIPWPFTGTNISGTVISGGHLRDISAGGSIRQGQGDNVRGWIDRLNFTVAAQDNRPRAIYAMSDPLFVFDSLDAVAPAFVSITDDVDGGPITHPDDSVIYTVTFGEAMMPTTVTAADFGNAGDAGITVDSVTQLEDPSVFEVKVTPTSPGTLRLQIVAGAGLTDLAGNPLDTATALADDTLITVQGVLPDSYGNWASGFAGLTASNPALDFDKGGLATGLEWVLGGDPTDPGDDARIAPTIDNTTDPEFLVFTYRRAEAAAADTNTSIKVQYGTDLANWEEAEEGADIIISSAPDPGEEGIDLVAVKIRRTLAAGGKLFVRLWVDVTLP